MTDIIFKGGSIQKGDRVKIPKAVVDTLDLKAGEEILLRFDAGEKKIVIEFDGKNKRNKKGDKK